MTPKQIGKYEILSELGKGGMGVVYKARDPLIDRIVAVKTIRMTDEISDDNLLERLRMEARSAGRLQHPNIVTIYDFGQQDDLSYIVMEYVEGKNLAAVIASRLPLSLEQRLDIVIQMATALDYAHDIGVIHRDIKPANVCLTSRGVPKILDFGLARFDATRLTKTGFTSGTVAYMSPERMKGDSGTSDDIFALGAVAYEVFTYQKAFPGRNYGEVVRHILSPNYPLAPSTVADLPKGLDEILLRSTAREREQRWPNAAAFAKALQQFRNSKEFDAYAAAHQSATAKELPLATVLDPESGDHPYSAGDAEVLTSITSVDGDGATELRDSKDLMAAQPAGKTAEVDAPRYATQKIRTANDSPTEQFDKLLYQPTEITPVLQTPVAAKTQAAVAVKKQPAVAAEEDKPERTVAARISDKLRETFRAKTEPAAAAPVKPKENPAIPKIAAGLVLLLVGLTPAIAKLGTVPMILGYAAAAAVWMRTFRYAKLFDLRSILLLAILARLAVAGYAPLSTDTDTYFAQGEALARTGASPYAEGATGGGTHPPYAQILFYLTALTGGGLLVWRPLLLLIELAIVRLLWDEHDRSQSFAYALFPLAILEGIWNGRVEIVASALLVASYVAAKKQQEGRAGLAFGLAAGTSVLAIASLPAMTPAANRLARSILFFVIAMLPLLAMDWTRGGFSTPIAGFAARSPIVQVTQTALADQYAKLGAADVIQKRLATMGTRVAVEKLPFTVTTPALAGGTIGLVLLVVLMVIAIRTVNPIGAVANTLGTMLIVAMVGDPAAWLLVVPFALLAASRSWLLIALFSPLVYLAPAEGAGRIAIILISYIVPLLLIGGMRLQKIANKEEREASAATA